MTSGFLDKSHPLWFELKAVHDTFGAIGCGPSYRSCLLVSAAIVCCDCEFWVNHLSVWDASVEIVVADIWWCLDVDVFSLPFLADVRVISQIFVTTLSSHQLLRGSVLEISGRYGGSIANPALTEEVVYKGAVLASTYFLFLMTVWLGSFYGGLVCDTYITMLKSLVSMGSVSLFSN